MMPFKILHDDNVLIRFGEGKKVHIAEEELSILVWNIFKGQRGHHFREDFKQLAFDKDFVLIQEALVDTHMPKLWQDSFEGYQWSVAQSFQYSRNASTTGVCIGSRIEPSKVEYIRARSRELIWFTPKISIFTEFEFNPTPSETSVGVRALFVCTHVLNFVTTKAFIASLHEIALKISEFDGPVLLAGDFNTWNVKRYLAMKDIFHNLKLEHITFDQDKRLLRLDHIFVRGFSVQKALVHHTVSSSDHYPLEIKLRLG
jgi:endonuclease/exonuclease/phosphatase (EEP) superfamily protein YafD